MCGILACIYNNKNTLTNVLKPRQHYVDLSKRVRHRGPDWSGIYYDTSKNIAICHERLSIVGVNSGSQPIINEELGVILSVNGEIYNHKELYEVVLHNKYIPNTESDCEVIIYLYKEFGFDFVKMLDGMFSFVLYDKKKDLVFVARDPIGIIPAYHGIDIENNCYFVGSELKSIQDDCSDIEVFPPGHYLINYRNNDISLSNIVRYYNPLYMNKSFKTYEKEKIKPIIRNSLIKSVKKRLMADVPFGVLLSGGLDSSLIASITNNLIQNDGSVWGNKLHSFSIGLEGAPDLIYAKKVADYLGTSHHEIKFTVQDGIDCLSDLIYHLETFDVTTIRASTPMFLLSRIIKSMGIKMVLSGEGADEVFGGYLYFHNAPNDEEFHNECISRVNNLHHFDCLRANKSTMSWGVEARVPFLDKSFLENVMMIQPSLKLDYQNKVEKHILRAAFDCEASNGKNYLPNEILWRQKEQFSDGVGYNWIDGVKDFCNSNISDEEFANVEDKYKTDAPRTKEALYYRKIFDVLFPKREKIVPRWIPRTDWEGVSYDPSGRAQKVHENTTINKNL
jgi:asparagine synthase (glutamine-hydrolysing)